MVIQTVNVRTLKDRLSAYLHDVERGDLVLVSDRGRVVAEIRAPSLHADALDEVQQKKARLIDRGILRPGLANAPGLYGPRDRGIAAADIDAALAWTRGIE